jgi:hypothetical protein
MSVAQPSKESTVVEPISNGDQIKQKILDLQSALQNQLPSYESLLHTIHRNLATDPDTVHLLTDEEIGIICAGLSKRTGVVIMKEIVEKTKKSRTKVTLEDL